MDEERPAELGHRHSFGERAPARELVGILVGDWRPSEQQVLQWIRIALAVGLVLIVFLLGLNVIGFLFGIPRLDLLKVLAGPLTLGAAVPLLNWLQKKRELDVEHRRAQDEALQTYLDQMGTLLLDRDKPLRKSEKGDEVRILARARTLTLLSRLDGSRKRSALQFLYESNLLTTDEVSGAGGLSRDPPAVDLVLADLRGANLFAARLKFASLRAIDLRRADLRRADLRYFDLMYADMRQANLREAMLWKANLMVARLSETDLSLAHLQGAKMASADLSHALLNGTKLFESDLNGTDLTNADLRGADLQGADLLAASLQGADLRRAVGLTQAQIEKAYGSKHTTLPEGLHEPALWSKSLADQEKVLQERFSSSE